MTNVTNQQKDDFFGSSKGSNKRGQDLLPDDPASAIDGFFDEMGEAAVSFFENLHGGVLVLLLIIIALYLLRWACDSCVKRSRHREIIEHMSKSDVQRLP